MHGFIQKFGVVLCAAVVYGCTETCIEPGVELIVRPSVVSVPPGDTVRFCTFFRLSDGTTGITVNSAPFARCDELYKRWLGSL